MELLAEGILGTREELTEVVPGAAALYWCFPPQVLQATRLIAGPTAASIVCAKTSLHLVHQALTFDPTLIMYPHLSPTMP